MITQYLRVNLDSLNLRQRGVLLCLYGVSAAPGGFQSVLKRSKVQNGNSTLRLTKREINGGLNAMKRLEIRLAEIRTELRNLKGYTKGYGKKKTKKKASKKVGKKKAKKTA